MPTYEYACPECQQHYDAHRAISERNDAPACPRCGLATQRVIGQVNFARSTVQTETRMSDVTGKLVSSAKDLENQIKQMNDETGTHYVLADPGDPTVFGVTDEGMDATRRANTDSGKREGTLWL